MNTIIRPLSGEVSRNRFADRAESVNQSSEFHPTPDFSSADVMNRIAASLGLPANFKAAEAVEEEDDTDPFDEGWEPEYEDLLPVRGEEVSEDVPLPDFIPIRIAVAVGSDGSHSAVGASDCSDNELLGLARMGVEDPCGSFMMLINIPSPKKTVFAAELVKPAPHVN